MILGGVVLVLVVAAVAVLAIRPGPADLDPDSPEGVVQRYLEAVMDSDDETAKALLDSSFDCEAPYFRPDDESFRISLESVDVSGDRATVEVLATYSYGEPPFDRNQYSESQTFRLTRTDGKWLISEVPWRFQLCERKVAS